MNFTKMSGLGNDFIIVNNIKEKIDLNYLPEIVKKLCARRFSIGADGFMLIENSDNGADYKMMFYNSDGTIGEMCGNGARCIARYAYENGIAGSKQKIETLSGTVFAERISKRQYKVRLNNITQLKLDLNIEIEGTVYKTSYVELGSPGLPHAVVEYPNLSNVDKDDILHLAKAIRHYEGFEKGANVNFYEIKDDYVYELTFERGVEDYTYACGTGTASVAAVLYKKGIVSGSDVKVKMTGGELSVSLTIEGDSIKDLYLIGDTNVVSTGLACDEDLLYLEEYNG